MVLKKRGALIGELQRAPMLLRPRLFDRHFVDRLLETTLGDHRDSQPFDAVRGLDAIAVVPMPLHILDTIEDHVLVALPDQVEKALPRHIAGLHDGYAPRFRRLLLARREITHLHRLAP